MQFIQRYAIWFVAAGLAIGWNVQSWHSPFFWDTILTSGVSQYYLAHGFRDLILPANLDAGHPPLFYIYITGCFKLLGKSLLVAHVSMLPFLLTGIFSFIRLLQKMEFPVKAQWIGLLLFWAIPAVATQYSLVSYDAVLLSLYLLSLVLFLEHKKIAFSIVLLLIGGITGRGIFAIASIFISCIVLHRSKIRSWIIAFVPAVLFYLGWYLYHYKRTGYVFSPDNGWSGQRGLADVMQLFRNGISIIRVLLDMGIVFLLGYNVFAFLKIRKLPFRYLIGLIPFVIFSFSFLFLTNPINHRYYLVVYVLMLLPVLKLLAETKWIFSFILMILLIAGHFQIYPGKISNAWDSTLAHLPYHGLRKEFIAYADNAGIDRSRIGTVFPMNTSLMQTNLSGDTARMINVNGLKIYRSK